ncbi:hypothetical protein NVP1139A_35 [Vibrio phage 1.139.A._10N.261.48.C6]|nr:hypothetical protein NVP1034O_34 [Vibrio phage 1.034.O._10N.261.46.B7]AUR83465.1 hypothetical protein NVP1034X_35 [Vibrio phage 1.034.X._10N.261.46.B7]AUR90203.1 hypothetical protein NVP1139A_35 [Vibrio phage 1.139.A._10N.261.48.C6]AUR90270.1 hypothetical protein NVP1139B_35 [Vibrio phage 1.139.B._10N.261.48.C6]AUR95591.1 hypothetical protein NVP1209O_34 [Vibrio phage 1.209.O._10N.222.52.B2]
MSKFTQADLDTTRDLLEHLADKTEQDEPYAVHFINLLRETANALGDYEECDL